MPLFQLIHHVRGRQIRTAFQPHAQREGAIGFRVVHKDHHHEGKRVPDGFQRYIDMFTPITEHPAPGLGFPCMADVAQPLWEDLATLNQPALEIIYHNTLPGIITGFRPVDGALIFHVDEYLRAWTHYHPNWRKRYSQRDLERNDHRRAKDLISNQVGANIFEGSYVRVRPPPSDNRLDAGRFAVIRDNTVEAVLTADDIIVRPMRNSTDIQNREYFLSTVESVVGLVVANSNAIEYNTRLFGDGLTNNKLLLLPNNMSGPAIRALKDTIKERLMGTRNSHSLPLLPCDLENPPQVLDLGTPATDMMYESTIALTLSLAAAAYRMNPATLNSKSWSGGAGAALSEPSQDTNIQLAQEEGLQADATYIATMLSEVAKRCHPDLRVICDFGGQNRREVVEIAAKSAACFTTRNEERLRAGLPPYGYYLDEEALKTASDEDKARFYNDTWNQPSDAAFQQSRQSALAAQQMADQQGAADDGYGQPPGPQPYGQPGAPGAPAGPPGPQQGNPAAPPTQPPGRPPGPPQMSSGGPPSGPKSDMSKAARTRVYVEDL
jgi:hypothetical protein